MIAQHGSHALGTTFRHRADKKKYAALGELHTLMGRIKAHSAHCDQNPDSRSAQKPLQPTVEPA
jgi:hypothetical protein